MSVSLWDVVTKWSLSTSSLREAQAILAHAAGENSPTEPGLVNEYLASLVRDLYHLLHLPVIVQGELARCLTNIPLLGVSLKQSESAPHYLSTYDIALWQKQLCDKLEIKNVVLVSYYPHYCRAVWTTEKLGLKVIVPRGLKEMYDPMNSQKWVRSALVNRPYELAARLQFYAKGWM